MLTKFRKWLEENRVEVGIVLLLFVVAAIPRMLDLGVFLTADEKNWIGRSFEFIRAFRDFRFNDMLQTTHPGVITMWLAGAAVTGNAILSGIPFSFENMIHFVKAGQLPIALVNSLAVPIMYTFLRKLFPTKCLVALVATLLIALNPFIVGYSRVVHVDALLMSFTFLAALATIIYAKENYSRKWLIASAAFSGLAILSKAPGVFMIPFFVLTLLVFEPRFWRTRGLLAARAKEFLLWVVIVALMFVLIWPAMLFVPDPKGNALLLKRDFATATVQSHDDHDYTLDGIHYPFTLLTRTTPATLVFAAVAILGLLVPRLRKDKTLWLFVAYVFFFILMMTLGAKKGDRYILPVFPMLDVLAVFGIGLVAAWFGARRRLVWLVVSAVAVVSLAATLASLHPYAIAYSNPLFEDNLSQELGWGEGLEQVGTWLNENDSEAVVAAWYPEELGAYTSARVAHINAHEQNKVRYIVLYRNMFGREPAHYANDFIDEYYNKREPVHVVKVAGKEYAWVYEKGTYPNHVGELLPGETVERGVAPAKLPISGVDVMAATFSGKATAGEMVIQLNDFTWRLPVTELSDTGWTTVRLPEPIEAERAVVTISTEGTFVGNAPTIRFNGEARSPAIRLRYDIGGGQEATEEDTRLLQ